MADDNPLLTAFRQTKYQISGHGPRNIQVLKDAFDSVDGETESDIYGKGSIIEAFQEKMAAYLGKERAVFFPSGTMAQQIALRIWCDEKGRQKVAYHPLCHLEIHEEDGLKELHRIEPVLLADETRLITLADVEQMPSDVSCLLLELPQREMGGELPSFETLVSISTYCKEHEIRLHLDGARLFEVLPFYQKTAQDICSLFDSIYVSFYKGIGSIAGAILAGDTAFIDQSVVWKRRHGGDLISLYPYIVSADHYFDQRIGKMGKYFVEAQELATRFNACPEVATRPQTPVSNMFHVHIAAPQERVAQLLTQVCEETGIGFTGNLREANESSCSFEVSVGDQYSSIPTDTLSQAFEQFAELLNPTLP